RAAPPSARSLPWTRHRSRPPSSAPCARRRNGRPSSATASAGIDQPQGTPDSMLANALIFIAQVAFGLLTLALLLRFYLQWVRAPYRNPLADFVNALTDFMVKPARRVIPGLWGLDLPTLLLAWLMQLLELLVVMQVRGFRFGAEVGLAAIGIGALAAIGIVKMLIYIVLVSTLLQALLSWINPGSPIAPLLD